MTQTTSERSGRIVGRKAELAAIEQFLDSDGPPRALMLTGGPGIGKTALWEAGVEAGRERGLRVLAARANGAETQLCFAALIDLLDGIGTEELTQLPRPQQQALEVALYRAEPTGTAPAPAAISVGFLNALRSLAAGEPLLVAVDDVQWLDAASAEAVAFAARRVDGHPVRFLFARRSRSPSPLRLPDGPNELQRLELTPLSIGATQRLLSDRLGLSLSRQVLRRIVDLTLGNPLFALELGRSLADSGLPKLGEEVPLPDSLEEVMGTRVAALPDPARRLVLAVALSGDLRVSELTEIEPPAALDDAVDLGVLVVDGGRVRPAHPLFATAAKARARAGEQRELHLVLAELATDQESRAAHLALAADRPDEELAAAAADAAARAAARGARQDAVVLAEHALRLTANPDERNDRLLALAAFLNVAGEQARLTDLLAPELESLSPGEVRVRACLLLSDGRAPGVETKRYLDRALAEAAGDARLRAMVLSEIATHDALAQVESIPDAEQLALEALETDGARPEVERAALYALAWTRSLRGQAIDEICERYNRVSDPVPYLAVAPDRVAAQRLLWRGDVAEARATLVRLLELADERGEPIAYALLRLHLCELELRAGAWSEVARFLDEASRDGDLIDWPCHDRCRALLAAGRGLPDETQRWAAEAIARAEQTGVHWDALESIRARGIAELLANRWARAAKSLRAVWEHTRREGVDEPGAFPVAPDLVEALIELGELDEATAVINRLRQLSEEQEHPWGLATTRRCGAMVRLASDSYDEDAAAELGDVAEAHAALGLPFDRARSLLSLGRAQRRLKKWGAARDSLEQAAAAFDELDSPGWAEQARAELARVGGRRRQASGELTPAEQRVAELAADGLANKEIASALFITVRTVEAHLKQVYAKLGIRSRTQLARRLSNRT